MGGLLSKYIKLINNVGVSRRWLRKIQQLAKWFFSKNHFANCQNIRIRNSSLNFIITTTHTGPGASPWRGAWGRVVPKNATPYHGQQKSAERALSLANKRHAIKKAAMKAMDRCTKYSVFGLSHSLSLLNCVAAKSISGKVPSAKPKAISPPKSGEPDNKATHKIIYNGPHGSNGVAKPKSTAAHFLGSFVIRSESLAKALFANGALGTNRSSPKANIKKKITSTHGKNLTTGNCTNFNNPNPIPPANIPIAVKEKTRAIL